MKILATIEARMSSSRLPGKVMFNLNKKPMIGFIYDRVKKSKMIDEVAVSTTIKKSDDILVDYLKSNQINYFRGSEGNVLSRLVKTCSNFNADIVVQLTGDNPLVDPDIIDFMLKYFLKKRKKKIDFLSNSGLGNYDNRQVPFGFDVQIFRYNQLLKISKKKQITSLHKEHPSLYFYKDGKKDYNIKNINLPKKWRSKEIYRLTVDTSEDFKVISKIVDYFQLKQKKLGIIEVYNFIKKNKKILNLNKKVKQKKV